MKRLGGIVLGVVLFVLSTKAGLTIEVGDHQVRAGLPEVLLPIRIAGGQAITEVVGAIEILPSQKSGTTNWVLPPLLRGIALTNGAPSIWSAVVGEVVQFGAVAPGTNRLDPNIVLDVSDRSVSAEGILFWLRLDSRGVLPGKFPLRLGGTSFGSTSIGYQGTQLPVAIYNGSVEVLPSAVGTTEVSVLTADGRVVLQFVGQPGSTYQVQRRREAGAGAWENRGEAVSGEGKPITVDITDDGGTGGVWFYRLEVRSSN